MVLQKDVTFHSRTSVIVSPKAVRRTILAGECRCSAWEVLFMHGMPKSSAKCVSSHVSTAASPPSWTLTPLDARAERLSTLRSGRHASMHSSRAIWHTPQPLQREQYNPDRSVHLNLHGLRRADNCKMLCSCQLNNGICRYHGVGNLGVEHCSIEAIRAALQSARRSQPDRKEFSRDDLVQWGLLTPMNQTPGSNRAPARRNLVGLLLGFGACDAKQMLVHLNKYGFGRKQVEIVVGVANEILGGTVDTAVAKAPSYAAA